MDSLPLVLLALFSGVYTLAALCGGFSLTAIVLRHFRRRAAGRSWEDPRTKFGGLAYGLCFIVLGIWFAGLTVMLAGMALQR